METSLDDRCTEALATVLSTIEEASTLDPTATVVPDERSTFENAMAAMEEVLTQEGPSFDLRDTLGEGGMGIVHLATQRTLGRTVAIKMLRSNTPSNRSKLK